MARPIDEGVGTISGYDLLARAVRVAVVVYLSPVILAVLAVGLVAMAVARLGTMMTIPALPPIVPPRMARP